MPLSRAFTITDLPFLHRLISGYVSHEKYNVDWHEGPDRISFHLERVRLQNPYVKHFDLEDTAYYTDIIEAGLSLLMLDDETPIALALCTCHVWNKSFWIHEFHVVEAYRGRGIGRQLMEDVKHKAQSLACRTIVCETQNTNLPAIHFYRRMGFQIEAIDVSLYTNEDFPDGEIGLFMKCRLDKQAKTKES